MSAIAKNEVQRAIAADEDALKRLCSNYIDNVKAYTQREKVRNKFTGQYEEPDERLMRSIEDKIDIPDSRKDDFRREIMNYLGALMIDGRTFVMFTKGNSAWVENAAEEPALVAAMKNGKAMSVNAKSRKGTATSYSYSLSGISAALKQIEACK